MCSSSRSVRVRLGPSACAVLLALFSSTVSSAVEAPRRLGPKPPEEVKRVVTLAPSLTEIVVALGAAEKIVGVSRFDELPEVKSTPRVGGFVDPSIEAVLALKPDLVLVQPAPGNQRPVEKLAELGTPILALPLHTIAQTLTSIREVGSALGHSRRAEEIVAEIEAARRRVRQKAQTVQAPRVLLVYEWQPLIVAGPGSFADELLKDAGAVNAAANATTPYPVFPIEAVIAARPDIIIDAAHNPNPAERLRKLPGLAEARWTRVATQDLMHPGPRLGRAVEDLFALLHPAAPAAGTAK